MLQVRKLSLNDFSFSVPLEQVAQTPKTHRSDSRLLLRDSSYSFKDHYVTDLPQILSANSLLIFNDTKVFPSRLIGHLESGAKVELFLLDLPGMGLSAKVSALGKPMKKLKKGTRVYFEHGVEATVCEKHHSNPSGALMIELSSSHQELEKWIFNNGLIPLPPYIKRANPSQELKTNDRNRYQTVYSSELGSVAAPTAGLHFTPEILSQFKSKGIDYDFITLHVGLGTFLPVKSSNLDEHKMHHEHYRVTEKTWNKIKAAKENGKKIISVGTTSFRCIESYSHYIQTKNDEEPMKLWNQTNLFIKPETVNSKYRSPIFDGIITNFHQPCSTLFMMICALLGYHEAMKLYQHAIDNKYRFYSYGDSSLLWFDNSTN